MKLVAYVGVDIRPKRVSEGNSVASVANGTRQMSCTKNSSAGATRKSTYAEMVGSRAEEKYAGSEAQVKTEQYVSDNKVRLVERKTRVFPLTISK